MKTPIFNKDSYPTEETLKEIREWKEPFTKGTAEDLLEFCMDAWEKTFGDIGYIVCGLDSSGSDYEFTTGGWSGNEDVINAMQENRLFWSLCWQESKRGGYHRFFTGGLLEEPF